MPCQKCIHVVTLSRKNLLSCQEILIELILYSKIKIALIFLPAIRLKDTRHPRRRGKEKLFDIFDYYLMTCVHSNSITNCYKLSWRQQQSCSFIFSRFNKFTQPRLISRLSLTPHCLSSNSCTCSI